MNKVGEGYFYLVYDIGEDRVLKKQKSNIRFFSFIFITSCFSLAEYVRINKKGKKIGDIYKKVLEKLLDLSIIGNPNFIGGINYEQDKVIPLNVYFQRINFEKQKKRIDEYIFLIKKLWNVGIHDEVYNFTLNTGVNNSDQLILIDFNELIFDIELVKDHILNKKWLKQRSYTSLPKELRMYFKESMNREITLKSLEKEWKN